MALFASNGALNSAYLICDSASTPCTFSNSADAVAQGAGGTSVASPAMAGIMALVMQKEGGAPQGLPNPTLYKLAAKETLASCTPLAVNAGNSCVFYDINEDNNAVPCAAGSPDCIVNTSGDKYGILSGYKAGAGYDLTTGLGSINANNLVNDWASEAPAPAVTLTPTTLTFASTLLGKSAPTQTVTAKNTGAGWLVFPSSGVFIDGTNSTSFSGSTTCNAPVTPGNDCIATITFTPKSAGTLTATLHFTDDASGSPQSVNLTGTGTKPIALSLSTTSVNFIYTTIGTTSNYESFSATNTSASAIKVGPITIGGADPSAFAQVNTCGSSLAAGATCWVYVVFEPNNWAYLTATLSFPDSADAVVQTVALDGSGEPTPSVTLTPSSLTFASTTKGTISPPKTVTLTNTGTWLLSVSIIEIVGANASSFFEYDDCQSAGYISAQQSCSIVVLFQPQATGAQAATMYILDNGYGLSQEVPLSGTGK